MTSLLGVKVIDLSRVLGGPFCTQLLADHGATVIKVEPPQGDETRGWGPPFEGPTASYFLGVNRNKLGMALNLGQPNAREILLDLLAQADVLVENFKPGTMEKWGLGFEVLKEKFPALIHCRVSGFGATGPLGGLPGYDAVAQAMSGLMSVNGEAGAGPLRMGVPVIDIVTGMNAAIAILLALYERNHSGCGQFVEATLYDSGISLMHPHLPNYFLSGKSSGRTGNAHPNICPYDLFPTAGDSIFLAIGNDNQFVKFANMLGAAWLSEDQRFLTNSRRLEHRGELRHEIESLLSDQDGESLAQSLMNAGVPCGAVADTKKVANHPHTDHRKMIVDIGDYKGTGSPVKLSRTAATYTKPPPKFAEHAREILQGLGCEEEKIAQLIESGAVPMSMSGVNSGNT
ncbi:CaiB/BaiF CoA-transferase family protein [Burkholderia sp. S171]|uniref:CaiB/BaiF CoA transferase family protein n=1 Tax=Burkholderia sp. S171 TaxID=1641860 RepID=UPI00131E2F53|nr:CoA transferase [Burkholderia sp. S171]